jgi:hypothetical protein
MLCERGGLIGPHGELTWMSGYAASISVPQGPGGHRSVPSAGPLGLQLAGLLLQLQTVQSLFVPAYRRSWVIGHRPS